MISTKKRTGVAAVTNKDFAGSKPISWQRCCQTWMFWTNHPGPVFWQSEDCSGHLHSLHCWQSGSFWGWPGRGYEKLQDVPGQKSKPLSESKVVTLVWKWELLPWLAWSELLLEGSRRTDLMLHVFFLSRWTLNYACISLQISRECSAEPETPEVQRVPRSPLPWPWGVFTDEICGSVRMHTHTHARTVTVWRSSVCFLFLPPPFVFSIIIAKQEQMSVSL